MSKEVLTGISNGILDQDIITMDYHIGKLHQRLEELGEAYIYFNRRNKGNVRYFYVGNRLVSEVRDNVTILYR